MFGTGSSVHIERVKADYRVPGDYPDPARLRMLIDDALRRHLRSALAVALAPLISDTDSSVWLIRRLDLSLDVGTAAACERIAHAMGPSVARSLCALFAGGPDGESVLHFPSRAAYLAQFMRDSVAGHAADRWYYEPFTGLRMLPLSARLRTAICDDGATGAAALRMLPMRELDDVVHALSTADARRVIEALDPDDDEPDMAGCLERVRQAWTVAASDADDEWRGVLGLWVNATRGEDDAAGIAEMARAVWHLSRLMTQASPITRAALASALRQGDAPALRMLAGAAGEAVQPLLGVQPADRGVLLDTLEDRHRISGPDVLPHPRRTPLAGALLLLPQLAALPIDAAVSGWPDSEGLAAAAWVRWRILLKCCGVERGAAAEADPVLREVMAIPAHVRATEIAAWHAHIAGGLCRAFVTQVVDWSQERGIGLALTPDDAAYLGSPQLHAAPDVEAALALAALATLRSFARRLPGFASSSLPYLWRSFLDVSGSVEDEPERRVVRVGRPQLHTILSMTGILRTSFQLRWLDDRPFEIFAED